MSNKKKAFLHRSRLLEDSFSSIGNNETLDVAEACRIEAEMKQQEEPNAEENIEEQENLEEMENQIVEAKEPEENQVIEEIEDLNDGEIVEEQVDEQKNVEDPVIDEPEENQIIEENQTIEEMVYVDEIPNNAVETQVEVLNQTANTNENNQNETQMFQLMDVTQIIPQPEKRESINLDFDSTTMYTTQIMRDLPNDTIAEENENENETEPEVVVEESAIQIHQETLDNEPTHTIVEVEKTEVSDESQPDQENEVLDEIESASNPIEPLQEDETPNANNDAPKEEVEIVPEENEEEDDQRVPVVEEPCVKKHAYETTPGIAEPETPRSRSNRINYAALASGSKSTPKRQTPLKTQTPARSSRKLKLQTEEVEKEEIATIEEEIVPVEVIETVTTVAPETEKQIEIVEENVEAEIANEHVGEEHIEEPPTAQIQDQELLIEPESEPQQEETVVELQIELKTEEKEELEPEIVDETVPTPVKQPQTVEGTPSSRRGVSRLNYATLNSGSTPKRVKATPEKVETPANKPKRGGRKVVTIAEEPEIEKTEEIQEVQPVEEEKVSRKRAKAVSEQPKKVEPEKPSRRRGAEKELSDEPVKKRGRQAQKKQEDEIPVEVEKVEENVPEEETSKPTRRGGRKPAVETVEVPAPKRGARPAKLPSISVEEVPQKTETMKAPTRGGRKKKVESETTPEVLNTSSESIKSTASTRSRRGAAKKPEVAEVIEIDLNESFESVKSVASTRSRRGGKQAVVEEAEKPAKSQRGTKKVEEVEKKVEEKPTRGRRKAANLEIPEKNSRPRSRSRSTQTEPINEDTLPSTSQAAKSRRGKKEVVEEVKEIPKKRGAKKAEIVEGNILNF